MIVIEIAAPFITATVATLLLSRCTMYIKRKKRTALQKIVEE